METSDVATGFAELNSKMVSDSLTLGILQCKKQTLYRTYLKLHLIQVAGYTSYNKFCNNSNLGISRRTVQSHIQQMESLGWVSSVPESDRIYIRTQTKVARLCHVQYINRSGTVITPDDLSTKKKFKRWLISVVHSTGNGNPIRRKAIQEKANICPKTQRKYEKGSSVKITKNFAILGNFSSSKEGDQSLHYNHRAVFKTVINGQFQILRQLPNSYISNVKKGIFNHKDHARNELDEAPVIWRYLERLERVKDKSKKSKVADEYCRKTRLKYKRGVLWFAEHINFEYESKPEHTIADLLATVK